MAQKTVKCATVHTGMGFELFVILDRVAKSYKVYKKWYEYNSETDFGWHKKKVVEYKTLHGCMIFITNIIGGHFTA